jgi:hypothetical protein
MNWKILGAGAAAIALLILAKQLFDNYGAESGDAGRSHEWSKRDAAAEPMQARSSAQGRAYEGQPMPSITRKCVACLVIPARNRELLDILREHSGADNPVDEWLAGQLKDAVQWFWYGPADDPDYRAIRAVAEDTSAVSYNSALDLAICLFYLRGESQDFESGTIGRRYDGILGLANSVESVVVSPQMSADHLAELPLIAV